MSLLELNLAAKAATAAKKTKVAPVVPPGTGPLVLEPEKKYITLEGNIVDMANAVFGDYGLSCCHVEDVGYYMKDGSYTSFPRTYRKTIIREWFPTWKEHDAWVAGKPVKADGYVYPYVAVIAAFGENSHTTNSFWHKYYADKHPIIVKEQE